MSLVTEKQVLIDLLETYKGFPCLWDQSHAMYSNKSARDRAYKILVDKIRPIESDATVDTVKKKLENMRASFRREFKKILEAKASGKEHIPKLWYFRRLTFLEEECPSFAEDTDSLYGDEEDFQNSTTSAKLIYDEPPIKIRKFNIDLEETNEETQNDNLLTDPIKHDSYMSSEDLKSEAEAFGRTVGLQLKQLSKMQKTIAEKLISEVIFYGRLNKLNLNSTLNVNKTPVS